jgi:hypothetical protein
VHCAGSALFLCNSTRTAFSFYVHNGDYCDKKKSDICGVSGDEKIRVEVAAVVLF